MRIEQKDAVGCLFVGFFLPNQLFVLLFILSLILRGCKTASTSHSIKAFTRGVRCTYTMYQVVWACSAAVLKPVANAGLSKGPCTSLGY